MRESRPSLICWLCCSMDAFMRKNNGPRKMYAFTVFQLVIMICLFDTLQKQRIVVRPRRNKTSALHLVRNYKEGVYNNLVLRSIPTSCRCSHYYYCLLCCVILYTTYAEFALQRRPNLAASQERAPRTRHARPDSSRCLASGRQQLQQHVVQRQLLFRRFWTAELVIERWKQAANKRRGR